MEDITLVIQGRLLEDTYDFYCTMYPDTKKIFSTWDRNEQECGWKGVANRHSPNDIFLRNGKPNKFGYYHQDFHKSIEYQLVSTIFGLNSVETRYAIKLRGDEWYSNLNLVADILKYDPERIHTGTVFFRKWSIWPYHPSDHLMAGKTENLKLMFDRCLLNILSGNNIHPSQWPLPSECVLGKSYMDAKIGDSKNPKEDFKKLFGIISMEMLKYYKITYNGMNRVWYSNFDPNDDGCWEKSISSMDEL
jgi:hypothetical protein